MRTLGAVLAGGRSSRFGSDKAQALLAGETLIDHALRAIAPHCDEVAVVGRVHAPVRSLWDWPSAGLGPLAGLAGALRWAVENGFDQVLTIPVDCAVVPTDLRRILEPAPAVLDSQPVLGLWQASVAGELMAVLRDGSDRSVRAFARRIGARSVAGFDPPNVNTPADLAVLAGRLGDRA